MNVLNLQTQQALEKQRLEQSKINNNTTKNKNTLPDINEFVDKIAQYIYINSDYKDSWLKDTSTCNCGNCYEYSMVSAEEIAEKIKEAIVAVYGVNNVTK